MKIKGRKNQYFQGGPKNLLIAVLIVFGCLALLAKLTDYTRDVQNMGYSSFLKHVEHGDIRKIYVAGQDVTGELKNGAKFETVMPHKAQNWDLLKENNVEIAIESPSGQISFWYFLPLLSLLLALLAFWYFMRQGRNSGGGGGGSNIFTMGKSKAKLLMPATIKENFNSVAGAAEAKEELKDIVGFLKNPAKYRRLGAKIPKGVLLIGEPGNGKTLLAKAVAGEAHCPFFTVNGSDFIEIFVGVGAARVRDLFAQARKHSPSIIFIDEIDAIGRQRGTGFGGGHDEREQTLNQLLTEMDGFQVDDSSVIVIAATNMPDVLDKALLRPGRFDRRVDVPFPDDLSREEILTIHVQGIKLDIDVDLKKIAKDTAGFSGADLANLVNKAAISATKNNQNTVTMVDFEGAHRELLKSRNSDTIGSNPMTKGNSNSKMFMPAQVKVKFDDVAGLSEVKEELVDVIGFLKDKDKYTRLGAKITRGVLLTGEPGNGKTLLARAVAGEANCPFFSATGSEFIEQYVGVGASRVRDLFNQARKHSPSIVFIDEIDAIGGKRRDEGGGDREYSQTLNQLLTEMDGFQTADDPIIIIAATNRPDMLDKALLRPGRFDRQVEVSYPDIVSREKILNVHARGVKIDPGVDLKKIARGTPGFSGADLANLINEAALNATKYDQDLVTIKDFEEARDKIMLGKEIKSKIQTKDELRITAYHESGHALVRLLLPEDTDPLHKVTIIPRGQALGVTHWMPERDKYTTSKEEMLASVMSALGGRAAEELVFNKLTTGAYSDFKRATGIVRDMVCYYGMSDLGPVVYDQSYENPRYSQKTAEQIDQEVRTIIDSCYKQATNLLRDNREKLNILSETLFEKETMYAGEIYELLGIEARAEHKIS